jgi:tetratricopeptide (TPR) repeat protein
MRAFTVGAAILLISAIVPFPASSSDAGAWESKRNQGLAAMKAGDYKQAEKLLSQAVQQATGFGATDERLSTTLDDLGSLYTKERKFDDARQIYLRVLKLKEELYGKSSIALIAPLNKVVRVTCANGKCSDTTPELKRLLQIRRSAGGYYLRDIWVNLLLLGEAYEQQRKYSEAVDYVNQAIAAAAKETGKGSRQTIALSLDLIRLNQEMSNYGEAERICKESLEGEEKICQPNESLVSETLSRYKATLCALGRPNEAAKLSFKPRQAH